MKRRTPLIAANAMSGPPAVLFNPHSVKNYIFTMNFTITENGQPIAHFLRREDAEEFLSNAQFEDGYKLYKLIPS